MNYQQQGKEVQLSYIADWTDPLTRVTWKYQLNYYAETGEIEMLDLKTRRIFLKRCTISGLNLIPQLLRPGATITILTRQLRILEFADQATRWFVAPKQERTLALIKPDAIDKIGHIVDSILHFGFSIGEMRMVQLSLREAEHFYAVHRGQPFFAKLTNFMTSGRTVAMELLAEDAVQKWRGLLGPTDSATAREVAPASIRAQFGTDKTCNACHGSDALGTAELECAFFFQGKVGHCQGASNSTLCLLKPHLVLSSKLGAAITSIMQGFQITAMHTCNFSVATAAELFELYRRVLSPSEFSSMVEELSSGPSLALEVSSLNTPETVEALRAFVGPPDPTMARAIAGNSLRASFGLNKAQNAVHCTDLEGESSRELRIAFQ